jgi:PAS domain S-box-containing protein
MAMPLDARYFPLVLDVVDQGVFTVDEEGHITSFNRAAETITGYRAMEVLGRECSEVFQTDICKKDCLLRRSIASRQRLRQREVNIHTKDGRVIPISITTAPLETPSGGILGGVEAFKDLSPMRALRRKLDEQHQFEDIVSRNPAMHRIFHILPAVSESTSTILICGASGTGKELVAKAIHNHGPRRRKSFVAVNCAALPGTLLESELFGYRKGAFTDAKRDRAGRIAQAEGGTLFLDEVGDLPKPLQVKLLRFLQEKTYEPLGSNLTLKADVRVITATHRDLEGMVAEGTFRKDLYFRLNVLQIALPPLSERPEDIPLLTRHFVQRFRETTGKPIMGVSPEAMSALIRYGFPGNIRELENLIERAFILCSEPEIQIECLPAQVADCAARAVKPSGDSALELGHLEADAIRSALARHGGNRTRAARELGIHRTTLLRKMSRSGMGPAESK